MVSQHTQYSSGQRWWWVPASHLGLARAVQSMTSSSAIRGGPATGRGQDLSNNCECLRLCAAACIQVQCLDILLEISLYYTQERRSIEWLLYCSGIDVWNMMYVGNPWSIHRIYRFADACGPFPFRLPASAWSGASRNRPSSSALRAAWLMCLKRSGPKCIPPK